MKKNYAVNYREDLIKNNLEENIYIKVNSNELSKAMLEKVKDNNYKIIVELNPNFKLSLYDDLKALISNQVDGISVDLDYGYNFFRSVVATVNQIYQEYQDDYVKCECDTSYPATALKYYLNKLLKNRIVLIGNISEKFDINNMPLIEMIALIKLCQNEGYNGVMSDFDNMLVIKETCGEDFLTISNKEEQYLKRKLMLNGNLK